MNTQGAQANQQNSAAIEPKVYTNFIDGQFAAPTEGAVEVYNPANGGLLALTPESPSDKS
ncbi:hypothetical protein [Methylobacterium sp. AMS5]|uniref:hypothetical protein n=1 Tax=Methylobacterium sp. AMS5 TaxID=925818 RepID=UPI000A3F7EEE|nr:hypothetical protein [Methylobacterium sp. AMS5]